MAVSLNTPSMANLRSDYAVSDAAMPARNANAAQSGKQQTKCFRISARKPSFAP